jgi:glycerol-3-phosphate dehydrogenase
VNAAQFDFVVVGAGDVGSAIARELARYDLRIALVDRGDVGAGTSKANTAILHSGFDAKPGTLEARLVARGHTLLSAYAQEAGIPLERTGAHVVAWDDEQLARLDAIRANAEQNGYKSVEPIGAAALYSREPHLGAGALGALAIPDEHIVCPWTAPLAWATQAVRAGVELRRGFDVQTVVRDADAWTVSGPQGSLRSRWIVNAAGLYGDELHGAAGYEGLAITPRRGQLIVFDKLSRRLVSGTILPVPTAHSKGVLIAPTVFGNVLVGPTAEDLADKRDTSCTEDGLARLLEHGRRLMPELLEHEVTATYAGLRAAADRSDYLLELDAARGYACAGAIRSTGLTSAMAIAEWLRDELDRAGVALRERPGGLPTVRMANIGQATLRPYADADRIAHDDAYGDVVCFCERATRGEIRDALAGEIPPLDLGGLRRRTRATMGRCQGFYCGAAVTAALARQGRDT